MNNDYPQPAPVSPRQFNYKLWLIIGLIGLILIFVGSQAFTRLTKGRLVINTNGPENVVTVIQSDGIKGGEDLSGNEHVKTYKGSQTLYLSPGMYFVNVTRESAASAQTVEVTARQSYELNMNPSDKLSDLEPVGDINTYQFFAGSDRFNFLDNRDGSLYKIDASNKVSLVKDQSFKTVQWADANFGIAQDAAGILYVIDGDKVAPMSNLPPLPGNQAPRYAVAPNRDVYIGVDKTVYIGNSGSSFKQLYTSAGSFTLMRASSSSVALISNNSAKQADSIIVVDKDGSGRKQAVSVNDVFWSPDSKFMFTTSDSNSQVLNSSLQHFATAPVLTPRTATWRDNKKVFYSQNNQLWQYDFASGAANTIASVEEGQTIVSMQSSPDGAYLYLSVQSASNGNNYYQVYRYGLQHQQASNAAITVHGSLPWLTNGCFLSLVNFKGLPTIAAVPGNDFDDCATEARTYVEQKGLEAALFSYVISNVLPSTPTH